MEEYLDIVDENGKLTGEKELRSVCHEKGLWHNVAVAYFFRKNINDKIEFLTHLRSEFKEQNPNKWALRFGGHVESGSTPDETIIKEIQEEAGINVNFNDLFPGEVSIYNGDDNKEFGHAYYYNFLGNLEELSFNDGEVQEVKWMTLDEIRKSMNDNPEMWASRASSLESIINDLLEKIA